MKTMWPLLIVALVALGVFSAIGLQGELTGLAGPIKHGPYSPYGKEESAIGLTQHDCILAREIANMKSPMEYEGNTALYNMIVACQNKGW